MRLAHSVMLLALTGAAPALAQPSTRTQAGEHFRRGEAAQGEGRFRDAIASYEQAYALLPHANALFNIAVCYEKLGEWSMSADYYERYLDENKGANDSATVTEKVRELRAKSQATPIRPTDTGPGPSNSTNPTSNDPTNPTTGIIEGPPVPSPKPRWHAGASYGLGFGDAPVERYLAHGGMRLLNYIDLDAILGKFGKNDIGIGGMTRVFFSRNGYVWPFARGSVTIGFAKEDDSSIAKTKFPIGLEAGGGIQFGARGRFEIDATVRWTRGGFDADTTMVDSYINDEIAVGVDIGLVFDIPVLKRQ